MATETMTVRKLRHALLGKILLCVVLACVSAAGAAQETKSRAKGRAKTGTAAEQKTETETEIGILHVQGNVYMLVGPKSNATVQVGDEGVLVVDTLDPDSTDAFLAAI